jgi:predicted NBD/HSP70 family sugar kinase
MSRTVGVLAAEHIAVGLVEGTRLAGPVRVFPDEPGGADSLAGLPAEEIARRIVDQVMRAADGAPVDAVGVGFPGILRGGVVEDSPNLQQTKGHDLGATLGAMLEGQGTPARVCLLNDADAIAAGIAAARGQLDQVVRVWFLGVGIGFGRYPQTGGVWEGGHSVVTLDPKETFCGCGGAGHLEGIMGLRAMRLRFLDLEPEEVFQQARGGDPRCGDFLKLWHRALAAATANVVHVDGPGKFFITGPSARFVRPDLLHAYLHEMVKMSPLQDNTLEVVSTSDEVAVIGAAVSASRATPAGAPSP